MDRAVVGFWKVVGPAESSHPLPSLPLPLPSLPLPLEVGPLIVARESGSGRRTVFGEFQAKNLASSSKE